MFPLYIAAICCISSAGSWSGFFLNHTRKRSESGTNSQNPSLCGCFETASFKSACIPFNSVTKPRSNLNDAFAAQTGECAIHSFAYISQHANSCQAKNKPCSLNCQRNEEKGQRQGLSVLRTQRVYSLLVILSAYGKLHRSS